MSEQVKRRVHDVTMFLSDEARSIQQGDFRINYNGHDVRFDAVHNRVLVDDQYTLDYVVALDGRAWYRPLRANAWIETTATDALAAEAVKRVNSTVDDFRRIRGENV